MPETMNQDILRKIAHFGDEYRRVFLTEKCHPDVLSSAWWEALLFFFARAFFQGRRDTMSIKVHQAALGVLNRLFGEGGKDTIYNQLKSDNWEILSKELKAVIGKGKVGKSADIKLTIDTFKYIGSLPSKNIVVYSVEQIKAKRLREHYNHLQHTKSINGIHSVGPKIASFYLRDVVSLYQLDNYTSADDFVLLQPVDTWVRRIALRVDLIDDINEKDEMIRQKIVEACHLAEISSLKFNQGAWFLGYHSFEIVLRNLDNIN